MVPPQSVMKRWRVPAESLSAGALAGAHDEYLFSLASLLDADF